MEELMTGESYGSKAERLVPVKPDRRDFLRDGLSLAGGTVLASAALELLRDPDPALGAPPPPRPDKERPTCLAVERLQPPPNRILTCDDGKHVILWTPKPMGNGFNRTQYVNNHAKKAS